MARRVQVVTGPASRHATNQSRVVIVGGGIAGLSTAMALSSQQPAAGNPPNWDVVLIESRSTPGGRAGSFTDSISGETLDYCQHVAMGCCTNLLSLLRDAELIDRFTRYDELHFYHPSTGISPFRPSRWLPAPLHLHSALAGLRYLSRKQRTQIRGGLWKLMRTDPSAVAQTDAATWLAQHGQDAEVRTRFWDPILISALGDVPQQVSMAAARKVLIDGFAATRGASDVWVPNRTLAEIFGVAMVQRLEARGVHLRSGTIVREILAPPSHGSTERASVRLSDGEIITADHIVVATSWRAASRLLPTLGSENVLPAIASWHKELTVTLASIQSSPITGLHLWLDRALTQYPHVVMVGTTAQWLFRDPVRSPTDHVDGHYYQVVISGRHALSDAPKNVLVERVVSELRTAFPDAKDAALLHSRIVTDPAAVYRLSPELDSRRPCSTTPLNWLHLAGDYLQTGWPATMEGAVISGRMAAESIVRQSEKPSSSSQWVLPGLPPGQLARRMILASLPSPNFY